MSQLNIPFNIMAPDVDETQLEGENPNNYVSRMSDAKYDRIIQVLGSQGLVSECLVITADTVVVLGDDVLGKPINEAEGFGMLRRLSGNQHRVLTSVSLGQWGRENEQFVIETIVRFRTLSTIECNAYWHTGEPQDKAGGYGIQGVGAIFIESIQGSYTNVVGLPLTETAEALRG
ncbi:MAG: septum formation protein, partial [Dinoroseobacter sp.]